MNNLILPKPKSIYTPEYRILVGESVDYYNALIHDSSLTTEEFTRVAPEAAQAVTLQQEIIEHIAQWGIFYWEPRNEEFAQVHYSKAIIILMYVPNQYGKTLSALADGIMMAGGYHPLQITGDRKYSGDLRSVSHPKILETHEKYLNELVPKAWLESVPNTKRKEYEFVNGKRWDLVSTEVKLQAMMGKPGITWILEDEEMDIEEAHNTLLGRIGSTGGNVLITQCPESGTENFVYHRYFLNRAKLQQDMTGGCPTLAFFNFQKRPDKYYSQEKYARELALAREGGPQIYARRITGLPVPRSAKVFSFMDTYGGKVLLDPFIPLSQVEVNRYKNLGLPLPENYKLMETTKYIGVDPHNLIAYHFVFLAVRPLGSDYEYLVYDELIMGGENDTESKDLSSIKKALYDKVGGQKIRYMVIDTHAKIKNRSGASDYDLLSKPGKIVVYENGNPVIKHDPIKLPFPVITAVKQQADESVRLLQEVGKPNPLTNLPNIRFTINAEETIRQVKEARRDVSKFSTRRDAAPRDKLLKTARIRTDAIEALMYILRSGARYIAFDKPQKDTFKNHLSSKWSVLDGQKI